MMYQSNMPTIELDISTREVLTNKEDTKQVGVISNQLGNENVILHAFDWSYAEVSKQAKIISQMGYHSVLVSPPLKSFKHKNGTLRVLTIATSPTPRPSRGSAHTACIRMS